MSIRNQYRNWRLRKHVEKFGSKNNGHFNYFNREWFEEYQTTLIFLLNHWLLKFWFRWILRIHKDCKFDEVIDKIEPHTYRIKVGENTYRSDFRTHQKFSKRIYYAFRPYWYLLHSLDWLIQRTIASEFSFGFDTLTVYPDAHPETNSYSGNMRNDNVNTSTTTLWNDVRSGTGNLYVVDSELRIGYPEHYYDVDIYRLTMYKSWLTFDTSALSNATVTAAVISLYGYAKYNGSPSITLEQHIVSNTQASNNDLVNSDWGTSGAVSFSSKTYANFSVTSYNDYTLDSNGIANLVLGGVSKFGWRDYNDLVNSVITFSGNKNDSVVAQSSFYSGTTQDPKLVVTYTLPATGNKFQMVV